MTLHADAQQALDDAVQLGIRLDQAWLLLAHWINTRTNGLADAQLKKRLQPLVDAIEPALVAAAAKVFERRLGVYAVDDWARSRLQRLKCALNLKKNP